MSFHALRGLNRARHARLQPQNQLTYHVVLYYQQLKRSSRSTDLAASSSYATWPAACPPQPSEQFIADDQNSLSLMKCRDRHCLKARPLNCGRQDPAAARNGSTVSWSRCAGKLISRSILPFAPRRARTRGRALQSNRRLPLLFGNVLLTEEGSSALARCPSI